jgi:hypothetical protein
MDKAAVLLRTVHAINQHTPIELPRDLSRPMIRWLLELGLKGEKMRATRLQELEGMGTKLQATARALPSGMDRHNILQEIGRLRAQVVSLQADLPPPANKAKGK